VTFNTEEEAEGFIAENKSQNDRAGPPPADRRIGTMIVHFEGKDMSAIDWLLLVSRRALRQRVPPQILSTIEACTAKWAKRQQELGNLPTAEQLERIVDACCRDWIREHKQNDFH
jgi:hypothetical protein